jgi:zinc protease
MRYPHARPLVLGSLALALPLVSQNTPAAPEPPRVFPYATSESVLDNGLRVVVAPMDSPGLMAYYIVVRTGSRNEVEPGLSGFAHFFEHMMFRGTDRYPAEKYNEILKRIGADSNAFTTDDWTCYHITASASALETVMEIESDRFQNLKYTVEAFQKEAGAVLGEYNKNYSVPVNSLFEKLLDSAYETHTYKHTTMGFLKDIEAMPTQYEYSRKFFDRWYRPDNCVLVVAGDVDPAKVTALARKYYGSWKRGASSVTPPAEPPQKAERSAHLDWPNPTLPYLLAGWHVPAYSPDSVEGRALDVLSQAAFSEASPLYKDLVLDKQWVEALSGGVEPHRDPTLFLVFARVKEPGKMAAVQEAVYGELEKLARTPLPEERVKAAKSNLRYSFLGGLSTPDDVALTLGGALELTGTTGAIEKHWQALQKVSSADVKAAATKYFRAENRTAVTLSHGAIEADPPPAASQPVLLPSSNPLVAVRILFHAGSIDDPKGKEGLAALTASMISEGGSQKRTYAELVDALYPLAAGISARADKEVTVVSGSVHKDNLEAYYALLREVLLTPRFDPEDFERLKADQINYLTSRLRATSDEELGKATLGTMLYAGHPYGHPTAGTVQGLQAITLDDVKRFYREKFTRDNYELGLAGGFPADLPGTIASDLGSLGSGRPERPALPDPKKPQGIDVTIVTKSARASAISIGFPIDVTRSDDDFYALMVANSYLGEHRTFNGLLMNHMRGDRGLNYGDYSYIENFIQEGGSTFPLPNVPRRQQFFSIWIRPVALENAHFAIRQAMRELAMLVKNGMTEADFQATREFLLKYSPLWAQTPSRRVGYEMDGRFYGKRALLDEVQARLPKLTVQQVNDAIRKHLQANDAFVAIVYDEGGAEALAKAIGGNAPSTIRYSTETRPEVLEEDKQISAYPLGVDPKRIRVVRASEMFEK